MSDDKKDLGDLKGWKNVDTGRSLADDLRQAKVAFREVEPLWNAAVVRHEGFFVGRYTTGGHLQLLCMTCYDDNAPGPGASYIQDEIEGGRKCRGCGSTYLKVDFDSAQDGDLIGLPLRS